VGDGNIVNIDLILFDQMQEEIQRTLKYFQFDLQGQLRLFAFRGKIWTFHFLPHEETGFSKKSFYPLQKLAQNNLRGNPLDDTRVQGAESRHGRGSIGRGNTSLKFRGIFPQVIWVPFLTSSMIRKSP
jgi:hypothetical protein